MFIYIINNPEQQRAPQTKLKYITNWVKTFVTYMMKCYYLIHKEKLSWDIYIPFIKEKIEIPAMNEKVVNHLVNKFKLKLQ